MNLGLMNRRAAQKSLPYDAEVEYLESSGTQWIDTGIEATSNLSVNIKMANHATTWTNINVCGAIATDPVRRHHISFSTSGVVFWFDNNAYQTNYKPNDDVVFYVIYDAVEKKLTVDNYHVTLPSTTFSVGVNYYLFARSGILQYGKIRIYATKMYNGTLLIRDFIPVKKNGVGYMYDKVSGKLFGNDGTSNFILGPDK